MRAGRRIFLLLATGFGAGFAPVVPGTVGTLAALPLAWAAGNWLHPLGYGLFALAFVAPAIAAAEIGRRHFGSPDPGPVVVDEWAGLFLTLVGHPAGLVEISLAFVAFRIFDILKPFPIRRLERLPGGVGIVLDDVAAAVYANLALWIILVWL